jgi:8-oxo-dGTP pyrophosphatase MutT (NUDIX family)
VDANAEIILVRTDGAVILQVRDDKPGIANPGLVTTFGGHIEKDEDPKDAALREINEETNLSLAADRLTFFGKYHKTKAIHGEDWDVFYYVATGVSDAGLVVYEGTGFTVLHDAAELVKANISVLLKQSLRDYFKAAAK